MTNFEKIKAMSVEEMALNLLEIGSKTACFKCKEKCYQQNNTSELYDRMQQGYCLGGIRDWLQAKTD